MLKPVMSKQERAKIENCFANAKQLYDDECISINGPPDETYNDYEAETYYNNSSEVILNNLFDNYKEHQHLLNEDNYNIQSNNYINEYENIECKYFINHDTDNDSLGREELINILTQIICENTFPKNNFNIGIYGEWGSGKSTFLNILNKNLSTEKVFRIIRIDASEYEEENKIWYNILKRMFIEYENTRCFSKLNFELSRLRILRGKNFFKIIMTKILVIIGVSVYIINTNFMDTFISLKNLFISSMSIVAVVIGLMQVVMPLIKAIINLSVPLSKSISKMVELPNFDYKLGDRESVKTYLQILQKSWNGKRIILMVDELDRCSKDGIIEFFKAIQVLNSIPNINIVFAVDKEYLSTSLKECTTVENEKFEGFLDKYVHFSISLNNKFEKPEYARILTQYSNLSDNEKNVLYTILEKPCCNDLTPRKLKKIVNFINLYKIIANTNNFKNSTIIIFDRFIIWYIMSILFSKETHDLYEYCLENEPFENICDIYFDMEIYTQLHKNNFISEFDNLVVKHLVEFEDLKRTGETMVDMSDDN